LIGDVNNRDVIIVDDEVDTGGSIAQAVKVVIKHGARDIYLAFIHPIFSQDAAESLAALPIKQIITTDTVSIPPEKLKPLEGRLRSCPFHPCWVKSSAAHMKAAVSVKCSTSKLCFA
jgi:ribose-phosphate pyrophosphokinase